MAFERKRAYGQALADHSKAIVINPTSARAAYNARAWTYFKAGKAALDLPDAQRALDVRRGHAAALDRRSHPRSARQTQRSFRRLSQGARQGSFAQGKHCGSEGAQD
jgi:hypothetical protein